jgi:ABC-type uncharacterized transport system ATPase subunit
VSIQDKVMANVIRMQPGDVLWVRMADGVDIEAVDSIRDAVIEVLPRDCSVIMTEYDLIDSLGVASLDELVRMREAIDHAIAGYMTRSMPEA